MNTQKPNPLIVGDKKVIIAGAGRSGTTFIVLLLTRLGFFTGFKPFKEPVDTEWRAGAEFPLKGIEDFNTHDEFRAYLKNVAPFIIKSPWLSFSLHEYLEQNFLDVGYIIVPVRDVKEATRSRLSVNLSWFNVRPDETGKCRDDIPFDIEKNMSLAAIGSIVETAITYRIPLTLMRFPDFIENSAYCFDILDGIFHFDKLGITKSTFHSVTKDLKTKT